MNTQPQSSTGARSPEFSDLSHVRWLAGLAMQSLLTRTEGIPDTEAEREEIALWSYRMAQAMKKMESRIQLSEAEDTP